MNRKHEPTNSSFKAAARSLIELQKLDDEQLNKFEHLLGGITDHVEPERQELKSKQPRRIGVLMAMTASVVMLLMVSLHFYQPQPTKIDLIANEVAMNHIKMKPLELKAETILPLKHYFTQLDFSIVNSALLAPQNNRMLGGRYCSIQGVTAAQIRFQTSAGKKVTLYEVGYDPKIYGKLPVLSKGQQPLFIEVKGISVRLWVEKGLLMAEARDS
ncbi:DUF3379 domain-containing protein [Shewanella sp. D64]|uniref:hypothetical protein n=1 Tax=unclassified Shewanella TaxID=196818 RepID=UPI0022BA57DA|nr:MULTISPECIES: hypothetical protein [unclassified Shewanella]MEC4726227.1 DUF3379 domain-containing protein [Shewanella sp. D64]MEC4738239.1 DUF3379 domain-containing protein [Shewanella sp. E94]WBJ95380.1 DUF3379 domain-containing protein [Shewanella sp. MTB7]